MLPAMVALPASRATRSRTSVLISGAGWMDQAVFVMDSCPDELSGSAAGHARTIALVACAYATGTGKKK